MPTYTLHYTSVENNNEKKTLFLYPFFEIVNLLISNKENVIYILFFYFIVGGEFHWKTGDFKGNLNKTEKFWFESLIKNFA